MPREVDPEAVEYRLDKYLCEQVADAVYAVIEVFNREDYDVDWPDEDDPDPADLVINGKKYIVSYKMEEYPDGDQGQAGQQGPQEEGREVLDG